MSDASESPALKGLRLSAEALRESIKERNSRDLSEFADKEGFKASTDLEQRDLDDLNKRIAALTKPAKEKGKG